MNWDTYLAGLARLARGACCRGCLGRGLRDCGRPRYGHLQRHVPEGAIATAIIGGEAGARLLTIIERLLASRVRDVVGSPAVLRLHDSQGIALFDAEIVAKTVGLVDAVVCG